MTAPASASSSLINQICLFKRGMDKKHSMPSASEMINYYGKENQRVHEVNGQKDARELGHKLLTANSNRKTFKSLEGECL